MGTESGHEWLETWCCRCDDGVAYLDLGADRGNTSFQGWIGTRKLEV